MQTRILNFVLSSLRRGAEWLVGTLMALMFLTFVLQITIRYTARLEWIGEAIPFLDPSRYGWTLEFCLLLWVWIIFAGCAFVVRDTDHVTFDVIYHHVRPGVRRWFVILGGIVIVAGLAISIEPTWSKFHILRLKQTATLKQLVGDWVRVRDVYAIYMLFLISVSLRYAWAVFRAIRGEGLSGHQSPALRDE